MKRVMDVLLGLLLAPLAIILCGIAVIPIMIESRALPFLLQTRLGLNERPFRLLKLRTMHVGTPHAASHLIGSDSILRTGRILRRFKLDELPQLWNVLTGDMSLVGPRPGLPNQHDLTEARRRQGVFDIVPGITGLAQIQGIDMSTPDLLAEADAKYLGKWSFRQDCRILLTTLIGSGSGDAAQPRRGNEQN